MTEADSRHVECTPVAPGVEQCTDTYCSGTNCWTIHTMYQVGGQTVGVWNGCGADGAEDSFCAYGVSGPVTVFLYLDQQDPAQPGFCATGNGCYITDLDG